MTEQEYNTINQYRHLYNQYLGSGELHVSYDIKEVLKPIYLKISGKTYFNMACGACALEMFKYLFNQLFAYELQAQLEKEKKRGKK